MPFVEGQDEPAANILRLWHPQPVRLDEPRLIGQFFEEVVFANVVPGFYFKVGVVPAGKASGGHHTSTFYADDQAVPIAMRALGTLALDYLAAAR